MYNYRIHLAMTWLRAGGSVPEAIRQLAERVVPGRYSSARLWPLDSQTWSSIFYDAFHMDVFEPRSGSEASKVAF